jgi:DnaJ-class molecular chaperone
VSQKNLYEVLGVSEDATPDQIRSTYRKLAIKYHPDKNPGDKAAEERFQELTQAFQVLSDEKKRQEYDARLRGGFAGGVGDLGDIFGDAFASFSIEDFLGQHADLFGGFGVPFHARRVQRRGRDVEAELRVDFRTAARGGKVDVRLRLPSARGPQGELKDVAITIPQGVDDGSAMRLKGLGQASASGGPPGDLILRIRVAKHPYFRREGKRLYVTLPVPASTAALGGRVPVRTLDGEGTVTIPAGTGSGTLLRLKGQGIQGGDLLAQVQVVVPATLTDEQRAAFETLREAGA